MCCWHFYPKQLPVNPYILPLCFQWNQIHDHCKQYSLPAELHDNLFKKHFIEDKEIVCNKVIHNSFQWMACVSPFILVGGIWNPLNLKWYIYICVCVSDFSEIYLCVGISRSWGQHEVDREKEMCSQSIKTDWCPLGYKRSLTALKSEMRDSVVFLC